MKNVIKKLIPFIVSFLCCYSISHASNENIQIDDLSIQTQIEMINELNNTANKLHIPLPELVKSNIGKMIISKYQSKYQKEESDKLFERNVNLFFAIILPLCFIIYLFFPT